MIIKKTKFGFYNFAERKSVDLKRIAKRINPSIGAYLASTVWIIDSTDPIDPSEIFAVWLCALFAVALDARERDAYFKRYAPIKRYA